MKNKHVVMGAVERGGKLRLRHVPNDEALTFRSKRMLGTFDKATMTSIEAALKITLDLT